MSQLLPDTASVDRWPRAVVIEFDREFDPALSSLARQHAAEELGIAPDTLYNKLNRGAPE
jgi:Bacterial regulatory protein, Fis family